MWPDFWTPETTASANQLTVVTYGSYGSATTLPREISDFPVTVPEARELHGVATVMNRKQIPDHACEASSKISLPNQSSFFFGTARSLSWRATWQSWIGVHADKVAARGQYKTCLKIRSELPCRP